MTTVLTPPPPPVAPPPRRHRHAPAAAASPRRSAPSDEDARRPPERDRVAVDRGLGHDQPAWAPCRRDSSSTAVVAIVFRNAVPIEPPTCWQLLTVAEATPASSLAHAQGRGVDRRREDQARARARSRAAPAGCARRRSSARRAARGSPCRATPAPSRWGRAACGPKRGSSTAFEVVEPMTIIATIGRNARPVATGL